jgi:hypothetical protein
VLFDPEDELTRYFETSVTMYQSSLCYIVQDLNFYCVCPQAVQTNAAVGQGRLPHDNISILAHLEVFI